MGLNDVSINNSGSIQNNPPASTSPTNQKGKLTDARTVSTSVKNSKAKEVAPKIIKNTTGYSGYKTTQTKAQARASLNKTQAETSDKINRANNFVKAVMPQTKPTLAVRIRSVETKIAQPSVGLKNREKLPPATPMRPNSLANTPIEKQINKIENSSFIKGKITKQSERQHQSLIGARVSASSPKESGKTQEAQTLPVAKLAVKSEQDLMKNIIGDTTRVFGSNSLFRKPYEDKDERIGEDSNYQKSISEASQHLINNNQTEELQKNVELIQKNNARLTEIKKEICNLNLNPFYADNDTHSLRKASRATENRDYRIVDDYSPKELTEAQRAGLQQAKDALTEILQSTSHAEVGNSSLAQTLKVATESNASKMKREVYELLGVSDQAKPAPADDFNLDEGKSPAPEVKVESEVKKKSFLDRLFGRK